MILVRHARPEIDPATVPSQWRLSESGRMQCLALAERLQSFQPDAVYTSPEPKARETAELLSVALRLHVAELSSLREHQRDGVPWFASEHEFRRRIHSYFATRDERVFGTESAAECLARFDRAVEHIRAAGNRQPILVTHATVMATYLAAGTGLDAETLWQSMGMPCYALLDETAEPQFLGIVNL